MARGSDWFSNHKCALVAEGSDLWIPLCALSVRMLLENNSHVGQNVDDVAQIIILM